MMVADKKMTKTEFIKWLRMFLEPDMTLSDTAANRIKYMLDKVVVVKEVEKIVYVKERVVVKERIEVPILHTGLPEHLVKPDLNEVAAEFLARTKSTLAQVRSKSRKEEHVAAREQLVYAALAKYPYSKRELGEFINRDRTCINHYLSKLIPAKRK